MLNLLPAAGQEEVVQERRLELADRSLMPGDVVRRMGDGKNAQRGYCKSVRIYTNLQVRVLSSPISIFRILNLRHDEIKQAWNFSIGPIKSFQGVSFSIRCD